MQSGFIFLNFSVCPHSTSNPPCFIIISQGMLELLGLPIIKSLGDSVINMLFVGKQWRLVLFCMLGQCKHEGEEKGLVI
jgi:hypothetical protein